MKPRKPLRQRLARTATLAIGVAILAIQCGLTVLVVGVVVAINWCRVKVGDL